MKKEYNEEFRLLKDKMEKEKEKEVAKTKQAITQKYESKMEDMSEEYEVQINVYYQ